MKHRPIHCTMQDQNEPPLSEAVRVSDMSRPHGAPRGLLMLYVLHMFNQKPAHGYELLQEIARKTEGSWRPGAGSIYPILKKLQSKGLIETIACDELDRGETKHRTYRITSKGQTSLHDARSTFAHAGQSWNAIRRIFIELIDEKHLVELFTDGTRAHFKHAQDILALKSSALSPDETRYMLKEYALILERQLSWVRGKGDHRLHDDARPASWVLGFGVCGCTHARHT